MDELAELFRESAARYIICLLDCCFSGGAGARVFDEAPILRDISDPYAGFSGKGRILFAASRLDQPALEDSSTRHGLFTKALLDVLCEQEKESDLLVVSSIVMDRVRAEAQRRGFEQTPAVFNLVEGGMKLPKLAAGFRFKEAFPEFFSIHISTDVTDLNKFGLPSELVLAWKSRYSELHNLQLRAVNEYRVLDKESLVVVAPTSSGKTFIGEMAAGKAIWEGRKAVFLLPYKALVSEKYDQFETLYGQELGMRVIRCSGDYGDDVGRFLYGKYDLALFTYEMFLALAVSNPACLTQLGLVVLDEAQFITDPSRGITVELILTLIIAGRQKGISPQIVALSAVIGDINHFDTWLDCKALVTTERPVKLTEGVIDRTGLFEFMTEDGSSQSVQLISQNEIRQRRAKPSAQDVIVPLAKKLLQDGKKAIIFRNQRGSAQGCAKYLATELGLPAATDAIQLLPSTDISTASLALREALKGGTAFHTANLNREERAVVEKGFRDPQGQIQFLAATTTVAAGINTPASVVVIAEQEFKGENGRPFTVAEYKNMAGRAGRLGFQEDGTSIIYAENSFQRSQLFQKYVQGTAEPIVSSFSDDDVHTWIIRLLAQVREISRDELSTLLSSTYGGYLKNQSQPSWVATMKNHLVPVVDEMIQYGLIEQERGIIILTLLGRACGTSSLSYISSLRLIEILQSLTPAEVTPEFLMVILQAIKEIDDIYTPLAKGQSENWVVNETATRFGSQVGPFLQRRATDFQTYVKRCKRACLLGDWIDGVSLEQIENTYTANPYVPVGFGEIRGFAEGTRFHLTSAVQILRVLFMETGPNDEDIGILIKRLEFGIPTEAVALLELPIRLTRDQYIAFANAGITDLAKVRTTSSEKLQSILDTETAKRLGEAVT